MCWKPRSLGWLQQISSSLEVFFSPAAHRCIHVPPVDPMLLQTGRLVSQNYLRTVSHSSQTGGWTENTQGPPSPLMRTLKDNKQSWEWESKVAVKKARSWSKAEPAVYRGPNRMWSMSATRALLWSFLIKEVFFCFFVKEIWGEQKVLVSLRGDLLQQQKKCASHESLENSLIQYQKKYGAFPVSARITYWFVK